MVSLTHNFRRLVRRVLRKVAVTFDRPGEIFPLSPELPLPDGVSEAALLNFLQSVLVADAPRQEMATYCQLDFRRFVYTYGLVKELSGNCLELGANPYFTTMLLKQFTQLELSLANYFGIDPPGYDVGTQEVSYTDFQSHDPISTQLTYNYFNVEKHAFPYLDAEFDVVLFCEIIEHLLIDPLAALNEIQRVLKPNGILILTTPNVNRLENVTKMIHGSNIYDPYSGYGPYGRHNREYNKHELCSLLNHAGFSIDTIFTADVHENYASAYASLYYLEPFLKHREQDLGHYLFVRAVNKGEPCAKKPGFLYRSYPEHEMERT